MLNEGAKNVHPGQHSFSVSWISVQYRMLEGESCKVVESHDDERLRIIFEKKSDKNGCSRACNHEMNMNAMTEGNKNQIADKCKV